MPRRYGKQTMHLRREMRATVQLLAGYGSVYRDLPYMLECGLTRREAEWMLADAAERAERSRVENQAALEGLNADTQGAIIDAIIAAAKRGKVDDTNPDDV